MTASARYPRVAVAAGEEIKLAASEEIELAPTVRGDERLRVMELLTLHSLTWLVAGNLVGLWIATLLLVPELGALTEPLTYGRIMPLHLNIQLYGWCALPLVGLLFRLYLPALPGRLPRLAVGLWSATLAFGCVTWLAGRVTGKLFLDWTGAARLLLTANFLFLAATLWVALGRRARGVGSTSVGWWVRAVVLAGLTAVPWVMWQATDPATYQSINPESGGTTGANVLGAALGTVVLFFLLPLVLGRRPDDDGRMLRWTAAALVAHFIFFALIDSSDRPHFDWVQTAAVASVWIWPPLLFVYLRRFRWSAVTRRWLAAAGAWAGILVASGFVAFLPGTFGGWKFTNALVAHAHLAMAGLLASLCATILLQLNEGGSLRRLFADRWCFGLWHGGLALHITVLIALGAAEAARPDLLFGPAPEAQAAYALRWLAGLAMAAASWGWLRRALAESARVPEGIR